VRARAREQKAIRTAVEGQSQVGRDVVTTLIDVVEEPLLLTVPRVFRPRDDEVGTGPLLNVPTYLPTYLPTPLDMHQRLEPESSNQATSWLTACATCLGRCCTAASVRP
jgi:hypothetical protein